MFTANYEAMIGPAVAEAGVKTNAKWRKPIAFVYGREKGVPFKYAVKTEKAIERAFRFGYEVVRV